jgi:hypothetical protein
MQRDAAWRSATQANKDGLILPYGYHFNKNERLRQNAAKSQACSKSKAQRDFRKGTPGRHPAIAILQTSQI